MSRGLQHSSTHVNKKGHSNNLMTLVWLGTSVADQSLVCAAYWFGVRIWWLIVFPAPSARITDLLQLLSVKRV